LAGGGGFEPPLMDPESTVLPLDDPPTLKACHLGWSLIVTYPGDFYLYK
jgi:hypothetical protein